MSEELVIYSALCYLGLVIVDIMVADRKGFQSAAAVFFFSIFFPIPTYLFLLAAPSRLISVESPPKA